MKGLMGMEMRFVFEALEDMEINFLLSEYGEGDGEVEFEYEGRIYSVGYTNGVVDEIDSESADMGWDE